MEPAILGHRRVSRPGAGTGKHIKGRGALADSFGQARNRHIVRRRKRELATVPECAAERSVQAIGDKCRLEMVIRVIGY